MARDHYYNAVRLRVDGWNQLKHRALQLARGDLDEVALLEARDAAADAFAELAPLEAYWAFPGRKRFSDLRRSFDDGDDRLVAHLSGRIAGALSSGTYRRPRFDLGADAGAAEEQEFNGGLPERPYFEVLVVDEMTPAEENALRQGLEQARRPEDPFAYQIVVVPSLLDGLIAVLLDDDIQSVVIRQECAASSDLAAEAQRSHPWLRGAFWGRRDGIADGVALATLVAEVRPELGIFLVTDCAAEEIAAHAPPNCLRVFGLPHNPQELHFNVLRGVRLRYETPLFAALKDYSRQPMEVFHALPISRGKSVSASHWIRDMGEFYGRDLLLAETSAIAGGLDSLHEPVGVIKRAQQSAARAFGAQHTYFVTNGTSTANKIVMQAVLEPGDIVLVDRAAHKSIHYGLMLSDARVAYLDIYPLPEYSMYGAVTLRHLKETLLAFRKAGKLDRVKGAILTNCTFDGIVYDVERVMEECLAIKPDLVFVWDEAWFAFAPFDPIYRRRTGMAAAAQLAQRYGSDAYRTRYEQYRAAFDAGAEEAWLATRLLPDPDKVRVRVYVTQSTHKTLTALRQGSMIHVHDQDFEQEVAESFHDAYMTHTSTSPNYQILASLDVGRRQAELEGCELVKRQVDAAMVLREGIATHPLLQKYFRVLTPADMIPSAFRQSGIASYRDMEQHWSEYVEAWRNDEFVLDPCRLTLSLGAGGVDGDTLRTRYLVENGIQVNKTAGNTVLFMTNIGTTQSSVASLVEALVNIARQWETEGSGAGRPTESADRQRVHLIDSERSSPPTPRFHDRFRPDGASGTPEGDLRAASLMSHDGERCEYVGLRDGELEALMQGGRTVVSASLVVPYPPGCPVLVPGQIVTPDILAFLRRLKASEIHGLHADLGLRVFKEDAIEPPAVAHYRREHLARAGTARATRAEQIPSPEPARRMVAMDPAEADRAAARSTKAAGSQESGA